MSNELINFNCEVCDAPLVIEAEMGGGVSICPQCESHTLVPMPRRQKRPAHRRRRSRNPTVPVKMGLPGGPGFQANVSRQDSGKMAFGFLGAILAIFGVIFGIRMANKS